MDAIVRMIEWLVASVVDRAPVYDAEIEFVARVVYLLTSAYANLASAIVDAPAVFGIAGPGL